MEIDDLEITITNKGVKINATKVSTPKLNTANVSVFVALTLAALYWLF